MYVLQYVYELELVLHVELYHVGSLAIGAYLCRAQQACMWIFPAVGLLQAIDHLGAPQ